MTFISLVPTIECLADETVLIQAWKKTSSYIRYHNWFSDTLELDRTAVNLREFIANISTEIKSEGPLISDPIRMVPAPKSQQWKIESGGQWKPVDGNGDTAKIRPLAHVSLRDQVIATAMMMCLGDRVETRQGDPATPLDSAKLHTVVSYGNRLFSDFDNGQANQRWGSGTLYRGFYEDYQTFLTRPEDVAERIHKGHPRTLIVQSDLRQFYDRVTADLLHKSISSLQEDAGEAAFFERVTGFLKWKWSDSDLKEVDIYAKQSGIPDFSKIVLPQGLVAAGFFANVALAKFDKDLGDKIDQEILPNIKLHDVARYVDDLRFVLSAPLDVDIEAVKSDVFKWIKGSLDHSAPGLSPAEEKTQVTAFRADERPLVQQSRRMARIQAAISGGFDPVAGGEILDSVLALVRAQERLAKAETINEHDPFRPVPDVRDSTVDRFVAGRFRSTYRSLRPQLWQTREDSTAEGDGEEYSQFRGVRTRSELDDEMRGFALELISKWVSDPSNVRLLRIALDLWPDPDVLTRVLNLLRRFTRKGGPRNAPRRIAWYCLSEIFRAGAVETGLVEDDEQLPSEVKVDEYRRVLREEALRIVCTTETRLPWYLKQQAYLLLATDPPDIQALPSHGSGDLSPYTRLLRFLKGDAQKWLADEFATYGVLARRSYLDASRAVALVGPQLTPSRLNRIASLDPNFAAELVAASGAVSALTPRNKADLGLSDHSDDNSSTLAKIVFSTETRNRLRNERALLSFASKLLLEISGGAMDAAPISPSEVALRLDGEMLEVEILRIHRRNLAGDSLYDPPRWVPAEDQWRFQLGFLLRFVLTAQPDFTKPARSPHWKEDKHIYRSPGGHWHERIHGFFNGYSAFGDDWLPISDWVERLLFGLLWWPGCAGQREDTPVAGTMSEAQDAIDGRLKYMREMQGTSVALLPLKVPGAFKREGKPLRACVVQTAFPSVDDFHEDDLAMSGANLRIRHRRHLSAALAAVKSTLALRETHKGMGNRLDWLILPELAVHPDDVRTHLIPFARAHKTIILTGLTYDELFLGQPLVNSALWVLPTHHPTRGAQILIRRQGKKLLAPGFEKGYEAKGLVQSFRPCQWLIGYEWSNDSKSDPLWLTAAICFDATDLRLAADLKDRSDIFAIPALNKDVKTFDNMALALHYHMHQMVVVANNGNFGGSNAYAPYTSDWKRQVFHMHGQPQASIAFFELDNVAAFKNRKDAGGDFKPPPAG